MQQTHETLLAQAYPETVKVIDDACLGSREFGGHNQRGRHLLGKECGRRAVNCPSRFGIQSTDPNSSPSKCVSKWVVDIMAEQRVSDRCHCTTNDGSDAVKIPAVTTDDPASKQHDHC